MNVTAEGIQARMMLIFDRPGTRLSRVLSKLGIAKGQDCGCEAMLARMNAGGTAWCREHMEEIVAHLVREATRRGWRFPGKRFGAQAIVRLALWRNSHDTTASSASPRGR